MDEQNSHDRFDLALSDGGVRAFFYSLGVVLYLFSSDTLRKGISTISSVSGGSVLNAVLATSCADVAVDDYSNFESILRKSANHLARMGVLFLQPLTLPLVGGGSILLTDYAVVYTAHWLTGLDADGQARLFVLTLGILIPLPLILATLLRRRFQKFTYRLLFFISTTGQRSKDKLGAADVIKLVMGTRMCDMPKKPTNHVFCATELTSGVPMFFTRDWSYSPAYGWASLSKLKLTDALYASAAFPLAFPPLTLKVNPAVWGGGAHPDRPRRLKLVDGGVYNNLGTDWRQFTRTASHMLWGVDERFDSLPIPKLQVVVNASSPPRRIELKGWLRIFPSARALTILYYSTLRPRLDTMLRSIPEDGETVLIDLAETPLDAARRIVSRTQDGAVKHRAMTLIAQLEHGWTGSYWHEYNKKAAGVKTTLESIGFDQAAQLMRHGYLSAAVVLHSRFASPGLETVPGDWWFYNFLREPTLPLPKPGNFTRKT
ncbi:MAG: patatin-like phospholipase family protein [Pseudonocardiaceae bacterium]